MARCGPNHKIWATNTNNEGKQQVRINCMFQRLVRNKHNTVLSLPSRSSLVVSPANKPLRREYCSTVRYQSISVGRGQTSGGAGIELVGGRPHYPLPMVQMLKAGSLGHAGEGAEVNYCAIFSALERYKVIRACFTYLVSQFRYVRPSDQLLAAFVPFERLSSLVC